MAPLLHCLLAASAVVAVAAAAVTELPTLWPAPASASSGALTVTVVPGGDFFSATVGSPLLEAAFERYDGLTFPHRVEPAGQISGIEGLKIVIEGDGDETPPQLGEDESYSLSVDACGSCVAIARASTRYGALRALETFSQLVRFDFDRGSYTISGAPWRIDDKPRFPHRGLMVDTGRHFLSLPALRAIIDSLPYAKLNVLHWHMVDDQSFPFESKSSPNLWEGAFSKMERYSQLDVESIVEYAGMRGIRVMVEFDMPGHAKSWCVGYPELCPSLDCRTPLNVAQERTFELIEKLLEEVTGGERTGGLFPDDFLHLGGDEVYTSCWGKSPAISSWLTGRGMSEDDGYAYFVKRVADLAIKMGRRPVQWSEVYDHFKKALPRETIVHVWKDVTNVTDIVANGYDVIRNVGYNSVSWYLDNLDVKWSAAYQNDPCQDIPSEKLCERVLGGHGEMWGEKVDGSNLQATTWPRLAAIAEKLWSPKERTQDVQAALPRIEDFRCLLLMRGVAAAPVTNAEARSAPAGPGSCVKRAPITEWYG